MIRKKLSNKAIVENKNLIRDRLEVLKKNPMYGLKHKQKEALHNIKELSNDIKEKQDQFLTTVNHGPKKILLK